MSPLTKFSSKDISFARTFVTKRCGDDINTIVEELCDEAQNLLDENAELKNRLFQIEQEQDPERQWQTILAAKLDRAVSENNGKDYLEISNSINNDIFIITIQRKFGQSPEQLRRSSDIRRLKAAKKITHLLADNKQMQKKLVDQGNEIRVLKLIQKGEWDEIKSRQDIQLAIDAVNVLIRQFNQKLYAREVGKLTNSMRESNQEAWTRAADLQWRNAELTKTIQVLKAELNRKYVEKSKFAKYRKRGRK